MTIDVILYRVRMARLRLLSSIWHKPRFRSFGKGSFIERPALLLGVSNVSLGVQTTVRWGARIEAQARFAHRRPVLTIGSQTNIEQSVHIMCQSRVTIGDRVSITGNCAIVDVTHPFREGTAKVGDRILDEDSFVEIGDDVFVGFASVILPNVTIGHHAVVGANSVVTKDVPPFGIAAGNPAKVIGFLDRPTL